MGTSKRSLKIQDVLKSILKQFQENFYDIGFNEHEFENDLFILKKTFLRVLELMSEYLSSKKLIIFLDSIDNLHKEDHGLEWLILDLPRNVKLIYSFSEENDFILKKIQEKMVDFGINLLNILDLNFDNARSLLEFMLAKCNRKLTAPQWAIIERCLTKTKKLYPLHLKLLFDIVKTWKSSDECDEIIYCTSIKDTIKFIFKNIESIHGVVLVSHIIFYLTLYESNGISESELEDILSIDDEVLLSISQNYDLPTRRFPSVLWYLLIFH